MHMRSTYSSCKLLDSVHEEAHKVNRIAINYWQISLELVYTVRVLKSKFFTNLNGLWSQAIRISEGLLYCQ